LAFNTVDGNVTLVQKLADSGMTVRLGDEVYTPSELQRVAEQGHWGK
ncbi:hypothetical protein G3I24_50670, partial [Micromonospora aurantiaca]|nr:hypothetical protein [Micromonospora aurantiaca]